MRGKELDEKGIVFLDDLDRPFLCRVWGGAGWLFYWHPDNHWVSIRKLKENEVFMVPKNLTEQQQQIYHDLNDQWMEKNLPHGDKT